MSLENKCNSKYNSEINNFISTSYFEEDEKIDEIMKDITVKHPRNPFTHFVLNEAENFKLKNKDIKIDFKEFSFNCEEKWKKLSIADKKHYIKLYEDEKLMYKANLDQVGHYLFKDINESIRRAPTAYSIFLNEKLKEGFEKGYDPKNVKKEASLEWAKMPSIEKKSFDDKEKYNNNWLLKAQKLRKISPISLFIQNAIEETKKKHKELPQLKDIIPKWKQLPKSKKLLYEKYSEGLNEEKEQLQNIYEIINGIKPNRPKGAFRIFLQEKAKNNEIKSLNHGYELWKQLSEEKKEEYLNKSHRCQLAYTYKEMINKKQIRRMLPKKPLSAFQYYLKDKKDQKLPEGGSSHNYWRTMFDKLSNEQKKKYEEKSKKEKEIYEKKIEKFNNKVFDMPHRPLNGFELYVSDRMPELRKEKSNEANNELIKMIVNEWQDGKIVNKSIYIKDAEKNLKRFKKQFFEFKKNGFYTKSKGKEEGDDDDKDEKNNNKRKKVSKGNLGLDSCFNKRCKKCMHNKDLVTKLLKRIQSINENTAKIKEQQLKEEKSRYNDMCCKAAYLLQENKNIKSKYNNLCYRLSQVCIAHKDLFKN